MDAAREIQLQILLTVVVGPAVLLLLGRRVTRRLENTKVRATIFATVVGFSLFLCLGTPFVRVGIHSEDLALAGLLSAAIFSMARPDRDRLLSSAAIVAVLLVWLYWPYLTGRLDIGETLSLGHYILWCLGIGALWALNQKPWDERSRFLVIGCLIALLVGAAVESGSARTAQACGAMGIICAGAGILTIRRRDAPPWGLHNVLAATLLGLTFYQTQYGEMAVGTASCIWLLPFVGLAIFRLKRGFLPSAVMVGIFSCLVGALTLSPWKLSVFAADTPPDSHQESPPPNSKSHGYGDPLPDNDLPAPPEAKSDFKTGYE